MNSWEWEFFEGWVTNNAFTITDCGPLHGSITKFSISRDADLNLVLETTSTEASTTNAISVLAGTVYIPTAQVKLESRGGASVIACGVISHSLNKSWSQEDATGKTRETSSVQALQWDAQSDREPCYTIEWLENMSGSFIWPHFVDDKTTGETRRTFRSPKGEIVLSSPIDSGGMSRSCVHISVEGFDLFVGSLKDIKAENICKPGFILYKGIPSEETRSKIRDCLSFSIGTYLIYLGFTSFDEQWRAVSFKAVSACALSKNDHRLNSMPPAPLGLKYEWEVTPEILERMVASLCFNYDTCNLRSAFWAYWHAIAAPVHMSAVHFGAAIESLQSAFVQDRVKLVGKSILSDVMWDELSKKMAECVSALDVPLKEKEILSNKVKKLNDAPQSIIMSRFLEALGIRVDAIEKSAWKNRNRAAHGGAVHQDNAVQIIRENKVLMILMNRILLAIADGSDFYYDYYTLGRPTSRLADAIPNDGGK